MSQVIRSAAFVAALVVMTLVSVTAKPQPILVQFDKEEGVYQFEVLVNGVPVQMTFDTGAADVVLGAPAAEAIKTLTLTKGERKMDEAGGEFVRAFAGTGEIRAPDLTVIPVLKIGTIELYNVKAVVVPIPVAILGTDVLHQLNWAHKKGGDLVITPE